jgi:colanic acid biosynthesis glycosyl transferase WcaI
MRILILSQWFQPEPFYKGISFVESLQARGHEVEVLTGFPNYPGGKVYDGYTIRLFQREDHKGCRINRVALYPSHDQSGLKRLLNYASFAWSAALLGPWLVRRPDVIYVYHPPGTIGFPAAVLRFLKRAPVVYDIQDMWPDTISSTGMMSNRRVLAVLGAWMKWVYRRANAIVVLSPGFQKLLEARGVSPAKVDVIYNWNDDRSQEFGAEPGALPDGIEISGEFVVLFAGTMGQAQALDSVLEAAKLVLIENPAVRFYFVGGGIDRDRLQSRAREENIDNVFFLPRQPMEKMSPILSRADALLVHLRNDPLFEITIPSKTQTYMAAGRPIIMGVRGDAADLVTEAGCGLLCSPEEPRSVADAVIQLARMPKDERNAMGARGRAFYRERMSMEVGVDRFLEIFQRVQKIR